MNAHLQPSKGTLGYIFARLRCSDDVIGKQLPIMQNPSLRLQVTITEGSVTRRTIEYTGGQCGIANNLVCPKSTSVLLFCVVLGWSTAV